MSYIPDRHRPEKDGYDFNKISEYEKGLLDGIDLVIEKDSRTNTSMLEDAISHAQENMSEVEKSVFDKIFENMKDSLAEEIRGYIDCEANELFTTMCERDTREKAPLKIYL